MKNRKILALLTSVIMLFTVIASTGCGDSNKHENEIVVKVWNYNGGVGNSWLDQDTLDSVADRFMKANEGRVFENGKTGVYVEVYADKESPLSTISTSEYSVFFLENVDYVGEAMKGIAAPIDDVVTGVNKYEAGKTIESKLSEDDQAALKAVNNHYYFLPHYQSYDGVAYNKTLFDQKGFYFAKNTEDYLSKDPADVDYGFIRTKNSPKSLGPNGKTGVINGVDYSYDDGLPSTVDEYIRLCEFIKANSIKPFIWFSNSNSSTSYQQKLTNALWAAMEGYDGTMAQFNFNTNGKKTKIITGFNSDGSYNTEEVKITEDNAYLMYQQESRYQALRFCQYMFSNAANFNDKSLEETSHTEIQRMFITGESAMIIEGTYWLNEATDAGVFDEYYEYADVETAFMPMPVKGTGSVTTESEGRNPVLIDTHSSFAFINANTATKHDEIVMQVAKEFLQFCYTDESLADFTVDSSVTRGFEYQLGDRYDELSGYAKSVWNAKNAGTTINPISANPIFVNNIQEFTMMNTKIWVAPSVSPAGAPCKAFNDKATTKYTARDYFEALSAFRTQSWWTGLK